MTLHRMSVAVAICVIATAYSPASRAQMHKCQTKDGRTIYQEQRCPGDAKASTIKGPSAAPAGAGPIAGPGKRKPEEDRALGNLITMASVEKDCREILGRYASLDQMRKGCVAPGFSISLARANDPDNDPAYDYRLSVRADGYELSVAPRRPGFTGYFTDGKNLYENPSGAATRQSRNLGPVPVF